MSDTSGGTVTGKPTTEVSEGTTITLTATANPGKWVRWNVEGIDPPATYADEIANTLTFIMPDNDVTVTPFVDYQPNPVGEVNVDGVIWAMTNISASGVFSDDPQALGLSLSSLSQPTISCPEGWDIPSNAQWTALDSHVIWTTRTVSLREGSVGDKSIILASNGVGNAHAYRWEYLTTTATARAWTGNISIVAFDNTSWGLQVRCIRLAN